MTNYNFIGIGINHYQYLQPLTYAQEDIQALNSFFSDEVRVSPEKTLTFTDNSSWISEQPTYPTQKNLMKWITQGFQVLKPTKPYSSSVLWFAFSGYGIQHEGQDYLLPVDGKFQDPVGTGIPVRAVFEALKQQGAAKIIVLMDMNRSTTAMGNGKVGEQTLELASKMGIVVVLSCRPDEFSHETSALGHGMFMAAVLEALRYHRSDLTLEILNNYLGDRLKELSDHHWRPVQTPVMVIPSLAAHREPILPVGDATKIHWQMAVPMGASLAGMNGRNGDRPDVTFPPITNGHGLSSHITMEDHGINPDKEEERPVAKDFDADLLAEEPLIYHDFGAAIHESLDQDEPDETLDDGAIYHDFGAATNSTLEEHETADQGGMFTDEPDDPTQTVIVPDGFGTTKKKNDRPWYLAGWQWLSLLIYLLIGAMGWHFFGSNAQKPNLLQPTSTEVIKTPEVGNKAPDSGETQTKPATPPRTQTEIVVDSEPETPATTAKPVIPTKGTTKLPKSNTAVKTGVTTNGKTTPNLPAIKTGSTPTQLPPKGETIQARNAHALTEANLVLRSSQASSFNQAIAAARSIKPGTPLYDESRTQINRWSRVILDIAEARAMRGDFSGAIAAARLVPTDDAQVYGITQTAIKKWQSQLTLSMKNRQAIVDAQELIIPYQASSYSRAINVLKTIKPNEPVYLEACALQDQWSRTIYLLANSRAAKNKFKLAVDTAKLIPADSGSYKAAQGAIARWQQGQP